MTNKSAGDEYATPAIDKIIEDSGLELCQFNKVFCQLYLNGTDQTLRGGSREIARVACNDIGNTFRTADMGKVSFIIDQLIDHLLRHRPEVNLVNVYYYLYQYTKRKMR